MIEQVLIFTLGFLVAGLLMMFLLPAYGARGQRLARRQLEMEMPISISEIAAERDQLRAEFATQQRRTEQRMEAVASQNIERINVIARQVGEIDKLKEELAAERASLAVARDRVAELEAAAAAAPQMLEADPDETALLRRAISDIGRDVLRMAESIEASKPAASTPAAQAHPDAPHQGEPVHAAGSA